MKTIINLSTAGCANRVVKVKGLAKWLALKTLIISSFDRALRYFSQAFSSK